MSRVDYETIWLVSVETLVIYLAAVVMVTNARIQNGGFWSPTWIAIFEISINLEICY